ncbi:MAG: outer membrane protein insertion porin family [Pirellulaceae bacterium]|jgi:outer membrane protein insertion porin family
MNRPTPPALPSTALREYDSPAATIAKHNAKEGLIESTAPNGSRSSGPVINVSREQMLESAHHDGNNERMAAPIVPSNQHSSRSSSRPANSTNTATVFDDGTFMTQVEKPPVVRSQSPGGFDPYFGVNQPPANQPPANQPPANQPRVAQPRVAQGPGPSGNGPGPGFGQPGNGDVGPIPGVPSISGEPFLTEEVQQPGIPVPVDVYVNETHTGRFMFGVGVNSDAGLTGQIVIDERNFDWRRPPRGSEDWLNGTAFRGAGQGFRVELLPGTQVQRYLINFTEPYLFDTPISFNMSGFYYDRNFFDWDEQRLGGRVSLGYRLTHDLSVAAALRAESVEILNPRVAGVADLDAAVGDSDLFSGKFSMTHDTRDIPFAPTEGHLFELSYEQVFGSYDYPRAEIDYRKYFLMRERPDGSGRHTLSYAFRAGFSGGQTPIFENYYAGGYSTMRGFDFRGASPLDSTVTVGGEFRFLGSVEYSFPLTADDMIKGVFFCDFGTVEEKIDIDPDDYRVAPGFGLRIAIPALGPAPLALDFAVPVARESTDDVENFSFFVGFGR